MRKLPALLAGGAAFAAVAGTAFAANAKLHRMDVRLADGSVVHVEYYGDVAPKVTLATPGRFAGAWAPLPPRAFGVIEEINRQTQAMIREAPRQGGSYAASYGTLAPGATSTGVVSVSNGAGTCTRTTQVFSQGAGSRPKWYRT